MHHFLIILYISFCSAVIISELCTGMVGPLCKAVLGPRVSQPQVWHCVHRPTQGYLLHLNSKLWDVVSGPGREK